MENFLQNTTQRSRKQNGNGNLNTTMKAITVFQAVDGSKFNNQTEADARDALCHKVADVMRILVETPKEVHEGKGWVQHDLEKVNTAKDGILEICRDEGFAKSFEAFRNPGRECHSMSIIGRILDDNGGPLAEAWKRFCRIDTQGREHQQPYYAYTNGPLPEHICVETRK